MLHHQPDAMHSIYSPLQPPRSLAGIKFVLFFPCSHFCILWALCWEVSLLSPRFSDELRCRYIDRGGLAEQQSIYIQSQQDNLQHLMKEVPFSLNTERVLLYVAINVLLIQCQHFEIVADSRDIMHSVSFSFHSQLMVTMPFAVFTTLGKLTEIRAVPRWQHNTTGANVFLQFCKWKMYFISQSS